MRGPSKISLFALFALFLASATCLADTAGRAPDLAFDPSGNHYLRVFEQDSSPGTKISAQFVDVTGNVVAGSPKLISVDRPNEGCFYRDFDSQNGDITTPTDCSENKNPAVAYNNGQYMIVWEVHGNAGVPSSSPDNQFVNIFGKIVDASTLNPLPGWEEGILLSKVYIAANNPDSRCGDRHACNDSQIQAWSQSINPAVAPKIEGGGFVVTWQSNREFIGCAEAARRRAWGVYGRYVDQTFSSTSTSNPPIFSVYKDDSTVNDKCDPQDNVDNGANPKIAYNETNKDFVIGYEVAKASGGNASIGAKRVTINAEKNGDVTGNILPGIISKVDGSSLTLGDIIAHNGEFIAFMDDGSNVRGLLFNSSDIATLNNHPPTPDVINLGTGNKKNVHGASNLGITGKRPTGANSTPEKLVVTFEKDGNILAAVMDPSLAVTLAPAAISTATGGLNHSGNVASDLHDFVATWQGPGAGGDAVYLSFIDSEGMPIPTPNASPTAPVLDAQPANNAIWSPTRLYLSWQAATDSDVGDTISYDVYFAIGASPGAIPYKSGILITDFVIQAATDGNIQYNPDSGVIPIFLSANQDYAWKICAKDNHGASNCSPVRLFHTDNSVVGWWRFDEDPAGSVCSGGAAGETVCDSSGNSNHGIPNGNPSWLSPPSLGVLGGDLTFDGINDNISLGDIFESMPSISVDVRYKIDTVPPVGTASAIIVKEFVSALFVKNVSGQLRISNSIGNGVSYYPEVLGGTSVTTGTFHRTAVTYDGVTSQVFLDNSLDASGASGGAMGSNSFDRKIGALTNMSGTGNYFTGTIDEIIFYNKKIPNQEISNNYNSSN